MPAETLSRVLAEQLHPAAQVIPALVNLNMPPTSLRRNQARCLRWVNRVTLTARRSLPIFPRKWTSSGPVGMSQTCHNRTHAPQQKLFDHLVGAGQKCRRDDNADGFGGLQIGCQPETSWEFYRQLAGYSLQRDSPRWLRELQYLAKIDACKKLTCFSRVIRRSGAARRASQPGRKSMLRTLMISAVLAAALTFSAATFAQQGQFGTPRRPGPCSTRQSSP